MESEILTIYIPVILAVVSAVKGLGLNAKYSPFLSIALGIAFSFFSLGFTPASVLAGIVTGLSASGLYSGGKTIGQAIAGK